MSFTFDSAEPQYDIQLLNEGYAYRVCGNHFDFYSDNFEKPILIYSKTDLRGIENHKVRLSGINIIQNSVCNNHSFDFPKHIHAKGYEFGVYVKSISVVGDNSNDKLHRQFIGKINTYLLSIANTLNQNANEVFLSLFLGRNSSNSAVLTYASSLGIIHLFVISGFHFSLIIMIMLYILKKLTLNHYILSNIILLVLCSIYFQIIGGGYGASRALFMYVLSFIAFLFSRKFNAEYVLILLAFFYILFNPLVVSEMGFILTYSISIILIKLNKSSFYRSVSSNFLKLMYSTMVASFVSSLFISIYNGEFVLFSFIIILFASVIVELILPLIILYTLLPFLDFIFVPLINTISAIFTNFLESVLSLRDIIISLPSYTTIVFVVLIFYLLFRKKLLSYSFSKKYLSTILCVVLVFSVIKIVPDDFVMNAYDLRDGEAYLIKTRRSVIVYDVGNDKEIVSLLKADGIRTIDLLIISHADLDHYGKLELVTEKFDVKKVIMNDDVKQLSIGDINLKFIKLKSGVNKRNDLSLCTLVEYDNTKILLTGDIEEDGIVNLCNKLKDDIDILKMPHHGSYPENFELLLDTFEPEYVTISGGRGKRINKNKTYEMLKSKKLTYYDTMCDGQISVYVNNRKLKFSTAKSR